MKISLIVACGPNGEIGQKGGLPWPKLSKDMNRFVTLTKGKPVIMGRKTWDSIPRDYRPLLNRRNIIVSNRPDQAAHAWYSTMAPPVYNSNVLFVPGCADALWAATVPYAPEVCVIGGGEIYERFLPRADMVYLTKVDLIGRDNFPEADCFFPYSALHSGDWTENSVSRIFIEEEIRYSFFEFTRKGSIPG